MDLIIFMHTYNNLSRESLLEVEGLHQEQIWSHFQVTAIGPEASVRKYHKRRKRRN